MNQESAMRVLAITGSYRKKGNTDILIHQVLDGLHEEQIETQHIYLNDFKFGDCIGCEGCASTYRCVIKDGMQEIYPLLDKADGLVIGSPTYFYNVTGQVKCFLNRLYCQELFDDEDRSVWMGLNEVTGLKYAVTIAVCEQEDEKDMGFTSQTMSMTLEALGYRVVDNIKALRVFKKGSIQHDQDQLDKARRVGIKLAKTLKLRKLAKNKIYGA